PFHQSTYGRLPTVASERSDRRPARHVVHARPQNAGATGPYARLWHRPVHPADDRRRASSRRGHVVSRLAAHADQGLGEGRLAQDREQPPRALLHAYACGTGPVGHRNPAVRAGDGSDPPCDAASIEGRVTEWWRKLAGFCRRATIETELQE